MKSLIVLNVFFFVGIIFDFKPNFYEDNQEPIPSYSGRIDSNDSLFIYNVLLKSDKKKDVEFGNRKDGIHRVYRYVNGNWLLSSIALFENGESLWHQKPYTYGEEEFFENFWFTSTKDMEVIIPFDSGKIWQKFKTLNGIIKDSAITYFRNGSIKEIYSKNSFKQYDKYGQLIILLEGETVKERNYCSGNCILKILNNDNLDFLVEARLISIDKLRNHFDFYQGKCIDFVNDSTLVSDSVRVKVIR
jgi:hypothetical protein